MTKEELEKEARKDVASLNGVDLVSSTMIAIDRYGAYKIGRYDGYLAGALPRENRIAEIEMTVGTLRTFSNEQATCIERLEKENAELKHQLNKNPCVCNTEWHCNDCLDQLTKATEIIKKLVLEVKGYEEINGYDTCEPVQEAEQFLSEVEK